MSEESLPILMDLSLCRSPYEEAIVNYNGEVSPCCHSGGESMGNAFENGFDAVWFGEKYQKLREERFLDACHDCSLFRPLNDYAVHFHPKFKETAVFKKSRLQLESTGTGRVVFRGCCQIRPLPTMAHRY
jgi:hypothetical protein